MAQGYEIWQGPAYGSSEVFSSEYGHSLPAVGVTKYGIGYTCGPKVRSLKSPKAARQASTCLREKLVFSTHLRDIKSLKSWLGNSSVHGVGTVLMWDLHSPTKIVKPEDTKEMPHQFPQRGEVHDAASYWLQLPAPPLSECQRIKTTWSQWYLTQHGGKGQALPSSPPLLQRNYKMLFSSPPDLKDKTGSSSDIEPFTVAYNGEQLLTSRDSKQQYINKGNYLPQGAKKLKTDQIPSS